MINHNIKPYIFIFTRVKVVYHVMWRKLMANENLKSKVIFPYYM